MSERQEVPDAPTTVQQNARGQILSRGDLSVLGSADAEALHDARMSARGCGRSGRRPFCDGTCEDEG